MKTEKVLPKCVMAAIDNYLLSNYDFDVRYFYTNEYRAFYETSNSWVVLLREEIVSCDKKTMAVSLIFDLEPYTGHFFEIYSYDDDYIIYGEVYILRLTSAMKVVWDFCARDIFIQPDDSCSFALEEGRIILKDWLGWNYHLGYDGKIIREFQDE